MDTSNHFNRQTLFDQLGLSSSPRSINHFCSILSHRKNQRIEEAAFWSAAQSLFLKEVISEDSDGSKLVDHLNIQFVTN